MTRDPHWGEFENRRKASPPAEDAVDELCARIFTTPDGQNLLAFLRSITKERALPPNATSDELRDLEGQRRLVDNLEKARERGLAALLSRNKTQS
jgi:hypothetical protein